MTGHEIGFGWFLLSLCLLMTVVLAWYVFGR